MRYLSHASLISLFLLLTGCPQSIPYPSGFNIIPKETTRFPLETDKGLFWGVGVSVPLSLYVYKNSENTKNLPMYCLNSKSFLNELQSQINATKNEAGCFSSAYNDIDRGDALTLRCSLRLLENGCEDIYKATIWTEQSTASTADFRVRATAWMYRLCSQASAIGGDVFDVSGDRAITKIAAMPSANFSKFVEKCRASEQ